jgi:predicted nucleic acid-binding protein
LWQKTINTSIIQYRCGGKINHSLQFYSRKALKDDKKTTISPDYSKKRRLSHSLRAKRAFHKSYRISVHIAEKAAGNYRFLLSKGVTVRKTIDVIIGTFCVEHDLLLIHNDRDFTFMAPHIGLKFVGKNSLL